MDYKQKSRGWSDVRIHSLHATRCIVFLVQADNAQQHDESMGVSAGAGAGAGSAQDPRELTKYVRGPIQQAMH